MQERRLRNIQLRLPRLSQSEWIAIPRPARPVHAAHERWTLQLAVTAEIRQPRVMPGHRHRRQRACMPHQQQRTGRRMIDGSAMIGIADSPLESIRIFAQTRGPDQPTIRRQNTNRIGHAQPRRGNRPWPGAPRRSHTRDRWFSHSTSHTLSSPRQSLRIATPSSQRKHTTEQKKWSRR